MGSRTYDPQRAGVAQPDAYRTDGSNPSLLVTPSTANAYGYVNGDPINYSDPTGHGLHCTLGPDCQEMQVFQTPTSDLAGAPSLASYLTSMHAPGHSSSNAPWEAPGASAHNAPPAAPFARHAYAQSTEYL